MNRSYVAWMFKTSPSHLGILILRVVIGVSFMVHGYPKIMGGVETWTKLGGAMQLVGISFAPAFWGACAAVSEFFGGLALVVGCLTRLASAGLGFTMVIAAIMHLSKGDDFSKYSHPIELLVVCIFLLLSGAGDYSVDGRIARSLDSER